MRRQTSRVEGQTISREQFNALGLLCGALQHLESATLAIDPQRYRDIVRRLTNLLERVPIDADVRALLAIYPAGAELYENLHYQQTGLCLHDPAHAASAEHAARQTISAVRSTTC